MDLDEIKVKITASTDGVRSGIKVAIDEFKRLVETSKNAEGVMNSFGSSGVMAFERINEATKKATILYKQYLSTANSSVANNSLKELDKLYNDQISMVKKNNQELLLQIKNRYTEQINIAKSAADAEIYVYKQKIAHINTLLKQDNRHNRDENLLDRIKRAKEQLKYETDEANKYELQKEINTLQNNYDKNKKRDALEDEKAILQMQIQAVKDSSNEKIKALEDVYNSEIIQAEQSLKLQTDLLTAKFEKEKEYNLAVATDYAEQYAKRGESVKILYDNEKNTNNDSTIDLFANLAKRKEGDIKAYIEREKLAEANARELRAIMERGTNKLLLDLFNHISDYTNIGKRHGLAYAAAFAAASQSGMMATNAYSNEMMYGASSYISTNSYNVDMTISAPVASPAMVARETELMLQNMTK